VGKTGGRWAVGLNDLGGLLQPLGFCHSMNKMMWKCSPFMPLFSPLVLFSASKPTC